MLTMQLGASITFLWLAVGVTQQAAHLDKGVTRLALSGVLKSGLSYGVGVPGLALTSAAAASVIGATETALVGVAYTWKTAYDETLATSQPGTLLMIEVTKQHLDDPTS